MERRRNGVVECGSGGVFAALPFAVRFYGLFQESSNPVIQKSNIPTASPEDV